MTDKLDEKKQPEYAELREQLKKVSWPFRYGSVKVQIREGIPALIVIEQTIKLD